MERILDKDLEDLLQTRVYLSRTLRVFHFRDIIENWGISRSTLHRYSKPHLREYSREHARKVYEIYRGEDRSLCYRCKEPLKNHARCAHCTILLHDGMKSCPSCIGTRVRITITL